MSSGSKTIGALSGCLVWFILVGVFLSCLIPAALIVAMFTNNSSLATRIVGPLVCPADSVATVETSATTYTDEQGVELPAIGTAMVCVNRDGQKVAEPAPLPNWIWTGLLTLAALLMAGVLALIFAAPAGALVSRFVKRLQKK